MKIPERLSAGYLVAREKREYWAALEKRFLDEIKELVGDEEEATFETGERFSYVKESVRRFSSARLKELDPELYESLRVATNSRTWKEIT